MYVCMYVWAYVCMYVRMYVCMGACAFQSGVSMQQPSCDACLYVYSDDTMANTLTHTHYTHITHTHTHTCIHTRTHTHTPHTHITHIHTAHTYTHYTHYTYTHTTHTHTLHIHTHTTHTHTHTRCAFLHFCSEKRPKLKKDNPTATVGGMAKTLSIIWKEMSIEQRRPYEHLAERDKERYEQQKQAYEAGYLAAMSKREFSSPMQPGILMPQHQMMMKPPRQKRRRKDPDMPKRNM